MKAFTKIALGALLLAGATAAVTAPADAQVRIGIGSGYYGAERNEVCDPYSRWYDPYRCPGYRGPRIGFGFYGTGYRDHYYGGGYHGGSFHGGGGFHGGGNFHGGGSNGGGSHSGGSHGGGHGHH